MVFSYDLGVPPLNVLKKGEVEMGMSGHGVDGV